MMAGPTALSAARLEELHRMVLRADPTAMDQAWLALYARVCQRLRRDRRFRTADPHLLEEAATDAIRAYVAKPKAFNSARETPLDVFVFGIAKRLLRDRRRSVERAAEREAQYASNRQACVSAGHDLIAGVVVSEIRAALPLVCSARELATMETWLDKGEKAAVQGRSWYVLLARVVKRLQRYFGVEARSQPGQGPPRAPTPA